MAMSSADKDYKEYRHDSKSDLRLDTNVKVDVLCMQTAVKKRDAALVDAFNAYNQSITSALRTRTDAQVSAWAKVSVNERAIALAVSEKAFTTSYNNASLQLVKAKNAVRKQFADTEKSCKKGTWSSSSSTSSTSSTSSASSVACTDLSASLKGAYTITAGMPDVGRTYSITGTGSMSTIGSVSATGSIRALGFIAMGRSAGDITVTQGSSTMVLHVEGRMQTGFSTLPTSFTYTVQSANGVFTTMKTSTGKMELRLKGDTNGSMSLEIKSRCDR